MKIVAAFGALALAIALASPAANALSFAYDRAAPLEFTTEDTHAEGAVRIDEVTYRSGDRTVHAALVLPKTRPAQSPAVLFAHWLGDPATTNRNEFLPDAEWLARRGVISLIPDQPWSQANWFETVRTTQSDAADSVAEVIALRRAIDALIATPGVDPSRIAFVGHDFGATYGALLAGADSRIAYAVFMAPAASFSEWFLLDTKRPPLDKAAYVAQMSAFDIPSALGRSTFHGSLVQFAAHDDYVPASRAHIFADAVPATDRTVTIYDTDHALAIDAATDDRRTWLAERLHLH